MTPGKSRRLATVCAAACFYLSTVLLAQTQEFEVASVKLDKSNDRRAPRQFKASPDSGRLVITGMTVLSVIQRAYGLQQFELVHDNNRVLDQRIDIEAKAAGPASREQMERMLQSLLAERFKLAVHREPREMNAFVLTVAAKDGRLGPKMKKSDRACDDLGTGPPGEQAPCGYTLAG